MALQRQVVGVDLTNGLGTKQDAFLTTKLTELTNYVFDTDSTLKPREGLTAITTTAKLGGAAIGTIRSTATLRDELLVENSAGLHTVHEATAVTGAVQQDTRFQRIGAEIRSLYREQAGTVMGWDCCSLNGLTFWAWSTDAGPGYYMVVDESTGTVIVDPTQLAAQAWNVRAMSTNTDQVAFIYQDFGANLLVRTTTATAPQTLAGAANVKDNTSTNVTTNTLGWDAATDGAGKVSLAWVNGANDAVLSYYDIPLAAWVSQSDFTVVGTFGGATVSRFSNGSWLLCAGDVANVEFRVRNSVNTATSATQTLAGVAPTLTSAPSGTGVEVWVQLSSNLIRRYTVTTAAAVTPTDIASFFQLCSRPFVYNSVVYAAVRFESVHQPTLFIINGSGEVAGRLQIGFAAKLSGSLTLFRVASPMADLDGSGTFVFDFPQRGTLQLVAAADVSPVGIARLSLDFGGAVHPLTRGLEFNDAVYYPGALPMVFDGVSLTEWGFNHYPDSISPAVGGAGNVPEGVHQWTALYEWTDAAGRVHRSPAAIPVSATVGAGLVRTVTVTVQNLRSTRKSGVRIVVYRTLANGTTFYRLPSPLTNDPTTTTQNYTDNYADTTISGNALLPSTGGVLEADAPVAHRVSCVHQNRLFMAALEDPFAIRYTQESVPAIGAEASEVLELRVSPESGRSIAIAPMDDKLIARCERRVCFFTGTGPNALGLENGYSESQIALHDMTATKKSAVTDILTPDGLWFQAGVGLRLLTRGLTLAMNQDGTPVGSEVDSLVTTSAVASLLLPNKSQVRFYFAAATNGVGALVYDYLWRQWSRFSTNEAAAFNHVDALVWRGYAVTATSSRLARATGADDLGTAIFGTWSTGWLKLAGVQGYQRVCRVLGLGKYMGVTGNVQIVLYRDYDGALATSEFTANDVITGFVKSAPAAGDPVQFRYHVAHQKCEALKIQVYTSGPCASWTNLSLDVGVKRGPMKLGSARTPA